VIGEIAWFFHFPPSELRALTVNRMLFWHAQARRIHKETQGHGQA